MIQIIISIIFSYSLLLNVSGQSQIKINQHGTFIIAAICKEGVVIVADSRTVFDDIKGEIAAYFENNLKLYIVDDIAFGMTGAISFSKMYFNELFQGFVNSRKSKITLTSFLGELFLYAKSKMNAKDYKTFMKNEFLICGFLKNVPTILWHSPTQDSVFSRNGNYKTSDKDQNHYPQMEYNLSKLDLYNANILLQQQTNIYLKRMNTNKVSIYGGNLSSVGITQSITGNIKWFAKQDKNYYPNNRVFLSSFLAGKIKMWYRSKDDSLKLRILLQKERY